MGLFDLFKRKNSFNKIIEKKQNFLKNNNEENTFSLLSELRKSEVLVPGRVTNSFDDDSTDFPFVPDLLMRDEAIYLPMFSSISQIPEDYANRFTVISLPTLDVLRFAHQIGEDNLSLKGLVLDPFTELVEIDFAAADLMDV